MSNEEIPVLLRVYNRISDLEVNIDLIRRCWQDGNYRIFIAANGLSDGFIVPQGVQDVTTVFDLGDNPGHKSGASQLLSTGLRNIPDEYEFVVTLEADTWILSEKIVTKYLGQMRNDEKIVWAGANWVDKFHSAAIDFAIVRVDFFKQNLNLLQFDRMDSIESRLFNDIHKAGMKVLNIKETYPTHIPKAMPFAVQASGRRRRAFPSVPMVTHHLEDLKGGLDEKVRIACQTAGYKIFEDARKNTTLKIYRAAYRFYEKVLQIVPKSRWLKGRKFKS